MVTLSRFLTGVVLLISTICVFAQINPDQQEDEDESVKVLEPITVTGYHIKRIDIEGPAPLVVFDREDFEQAGINTLEEFARYLPINLPEELRDDGAIGATGFDLRGIGIDTTLVLVNGFRIAPYAQLAENTVDINSIPVSAIDRVEILKDGASAIYGADAIAGVVNIILRSDFNGMEASGGYGISERGDDREVFADFVAGRYHARGNIMFSLSWYDREPQAMRDREWSGNADFSSKGGLDSRSSVGSPPSMYRYDTGLSEADPECGSDPLAGSVGDSHWGPDWGTSCKYNYPQNADLLWGIERLGASLSGRYQINTKLSLFGDVLYSNVDGEIDRAPSPMSSSPLVETYTGFPYVPANHPGNPFGTNGEVLSRALDIGNRTHINNSNAYRVLLGLEGMWGDWDWNLSGLVSKNEVKKTFLNQIPLFDYQLALLGMGGPNGDLWYNPFGFEPQNDPAILDWLRATTRLKDTSEERSADLLFSRLFGSLPGGPVGVAIGLQYREQKLDQWADELLLSGDLGPVHVPISADRDIGSAFIEFNLPLLDNLEAQLALRYEDYSDFGSTTNPKAALRWQPLPALMFRVSYSTSFKPPSFYELYDPLFHDLKFYRDWERCEYTGALEDCGRYQYPVEQSGNPDLGPEEGKSWFAGMVWEPGFLPGFEFQLDFWKFHHNERIEWIDGHVVLELGGDFGIIREPTGPDGIPGRIILIRETFINTDKLLTQGFDTTLRYSWQTDRAGDFQAGLMHTYIDKWVVTDSVNLYIQDVNYAGTYRWNNALPRNRANLNFSWSKGPHGAATNIHYIGHYENWAYLFVDGVETDEPMVIPSHTTLDLQYSYSFERLRNATLRIGCNNVTDKDPPLTYWPFPEAFHDARGRFFYVRWTQPIR
jgi:iron complex outermembrane receptor protein